MKKRSKNNIKKILLHSFFILFIFITLIPVLYTLSISFSVNSNVVSDNFSFIPKPFTFENYINLLTKTDLLIWFKNTIILSVFTLLLALFVGIPAAYAFSRKSFKGSKLLQKSLIMLNAFPAILSMFAIWYLMSGPLYLVNTYIGLIIIYAGTMTIFTVINMKGYFDSIPKEIEEAARIDGANEWQIIIKVLLPLAKPAIVVTSIMILIFVWNEYLFSTTFMIGADKYTLAAGLYSLQAGEISGSWSLFSAAATLISFPILIVFLSIQKHLRSGLTVGGVKD